MRRIQCACKYAQLPETPAASLRKQQHPHLYVAHFSCAAGWSADMCMLYKYQRRGMPYCPTASGTRCCCCSCCCWWCHAVALLLPLSCDPAASVAAAACGAWCASSAPSNSLRMLHTEHVSTPRGPHAHCGIVEQQHPCARTCSFVCCCCCCCCWAAPS
jgi:hypothetical protein